MDDSGYSDCILTNVVSSEECITGRLSKRPKIETDEDFSLTLIPGDGHCIANCFAVHYKMELDKVLDLLDTDFRENTSVYTVFCTFSDNEIIKQVYQYNTEKRHDSTIHLFKYQDHFNLFWRTSWNISTSFGECTKSTRCENTQEEECNPSNNEIS